MLGRQNQESIATRCRPRQSPECSSKAHAARPTAGCGCEQAIRMNLGRCSWHHAVKCLLQIRIQSSGGALHWRGPHERRRPPIMRRRQRRSLATLDFLHFCAAQRRPGGGAEGREKRFLFELFKIFILLLEVGFKVGAVKGCLSCDAPLKSPVNRPAARLNPIGVPDEHRLTRSAGR